LKVLSKNAELCIDCGLCEETCSKAYFKENNREKSCIKIKGGPENDINVCNQCGVCNDICPVKALSRNKAGVVVLNKKVCVGCLMCVAFCPEKAMRQHDEHVEPFKCIACNLCEKVCPTGAIKIEEVDGPMLEKLDKIALGY